MKLLDGIIRTCDILTSNETTNHTESDGNRGDHRKRNGHIEGRYWSMSFSLAGSIMTCHNMKKLYRRSPGKTLKNICSRREKIRMSPNERYFRLSLRNQPHRDINTLRRDAEEGRKVHKEIVWGCLYSRLTGRSGKKHNNPI
ncbi:hypothetical protein PR048_020966 [Dryococelus australis]|uniref:Uncharacterized protein n=1 Tax=Dryococelus australis TaxID=614101 RepID=A0ABQ9GWX0_9NEOP|nr:hypothetical protein PR048_020966 [Dryococelus australis]